MTNSPTARLPDYPGRVGWAVAAFFIVLYVFLCSGRLNSGDACGQLDAAMLLIQTGSLGTKVSRG
jgi:hypothetical protein